jgi:hypothetical protein
MSMQGAAIMQIVQAAIEAGQKVSSGISAYWNAKSQKNTLKASARLADVDARSAELSAQSELLRGERQVGALTMQAGQVQARQRAAIAANGFDLAVGSAAELQATTDVIKEMEVNTLLANAVRGAWGHRMQAQESTNQADMMRATASAINPTLIAENSFLMGAAQVAPQWYQVVQSFWNQTATPSTQAAGTGSGMAATGGSTSLRDTGGISSSWGASFLWGA